MSLVEKLQQLNIQFTQNEDLVNHSTLRVTAFAKVFVELKDLETAQTLFKIINEEKVPFVIVGEGSNTLFSKEEYELVIKISIKGKETLEENDESVLIKVGAGETWHEFVEYCVNKNLAGNENLAYIPGTIGAAPVQNIAAYGQVQEDTFETLEAINIQTGEIKIFNKEECQFSYRTSIFKKELKGQYIIVGVNYRVYKVEEYIPETSYHSRYESLQGELSQISNPPYTIKDVFNAVISIRKKKLPIVGEVGTLGSFFLNPFITKEKLDSLQVKFPNIQFYPVEKMQYPGLDDEILKASSIVKIPAGWLLEELKWRGKYEGNVGSSEKHSLCVVTKGPVKGIDVTNFMKEMQDSVYEATGIKLESEVNIV
jgi:UDP-N-acetylmuramate dehydrogenase